MACFTTIQKPTWLRRFFKDLIAVTNASQPITIYCDNQAVITYIRDLRHHSKSKYIENKYNFMWDIVAQKKALITKPATKDLYMLHLRFLGLPKLYIFVLKLNHNDIMY